MTEDRKTVLVVDDEPAVRKVLGRTLRQDGYEVLTAENGNAAWDLIKSACPDMVLLDLMMPEMDGTELCRRVREDPDTQDMPVIMVTAKGRIMAAVEGLDGGADDYVVKPFDRKQLLERLKAMDGKLRTKSRQERAAPARSVLVADDEESVVDFLVETLRGEGYRVEAANSGRKALEKLAAHAPDVLFVDLMMPEVSGLDVIEHIGNTPALKKVRVIVLTARHLTPQETDFLQSRVELIIQKDSKSLPEILATVKERLKSLGDRR